MKDFLVVFQYELKNQLRKKSTRVTFMVLILLALLLTSLPRLIPLFNSGTASPAHGGAANQNSITDAGYVFTDDMLQAQLLPALGVDAGSIYPGRDALIQALKSNVIRVGFVFRSPTSFETLYQDRAAGSDEDARMSKLLEQAQLQKLLDEKGLSIQDLQDIDNIRVNAEVTVLGKNSLNNMLLSMVMMVLIYMLVLLYGNSVSSIIAREKDSKTMEILITSTRPARLILGKVAAAGCAAVLQYSLIIIAGVAGYQANKAFYPEALVSMLSGALTPGYLWSYIIFSLLGFIMYLFMFAALGSTVSKMEDLGGATALIQILFVFGYLSATVTAQMPSSTISVVTSILPFTSVMVMPLRNSLMTVPWLEMILAGVLMVLFVVLFAFLSIKIYRWGSLNYGNKTKLSRIIREALRETSGK
jgi:ABC-2 type transport system permease protein